MLFRLLFFVRINNGLGKKLKQIYYRDTYIGCLNWLLGDHLGSTSMTTDASGVVVSEVRYSTFGEIRYQNGTSTTDYLYTGQRQEAEIGLYYFVARWYDPAIGRFIQADSMIPNPTKSVAFDRFAYNWNNPIIYTDPSGHTPIYLDGEQFVETDKSQGITNHVSTTVTNIEKCAKNPFDASCHVADPHNSAPNKNKVVASAAAEIGVSIICEFCDWAITINYWRQGDFSWLDLVGLLPVVPASVRGAVKEATNSLRYSDEVADILKGLCSFTGETLVETTDGKKPISEIEVGDFVLAYNEKTDSFGYYTVTAVWSHPDDQLIKLNINGEIIITTIDHPFFTIEEDWVEAGLLSEGDAIASFVNTLGTINEITFLEGYRLVYNLTVDSANTYVVGDGKWLVHNFCPIDDMNPKSINKAIRSLEKQVQKHTSKLQNYMKNPLKYDNRGYLKQALQQGDLDRYNAIYQARISELEHQIQNFQAQIDELRNLQGP